MSREWRTSRPWIITVCNYAMRPAQHRPRRRDAHIAFVPKEAAEVRGERTLRYVCAGAVGVWKIQGAWLPV